jgi:hypothetical protein
VDVNKSKDSAAVLTRPPILTSVHAGDLPTATTVSVAERIPVLLHFTFLHRLTFSLTYLNLIQNYRGARTCQVHLRWVEFGQKLLRFYKIGLLFVQVNGDGDAFIAVILYSQFEVHVVLLFSFFPSLEFICGQIVVELTDFLNLEEPEIVTLIKIHLHSRS